MDNLKPSLYKLSADYSTVLEMLVDPDADEQTILDTLESIESVIEVKSDDYAYIIRGFEDDIKACKAEIARLQERIRVRQNAVERMKGVMDTAMRSLGVRQVKTALNTWRIQKNGGTAPLGYRSDFDVASLPPEMVKTEARPIAKLIVQALEDGMNLPGVYLKPRGESLRLS